MGLFLLGLPIITVILSLLIKNKRLLYALGIVAAGGLLAVSLLITACSPGPSASPSAAPCCPCSPC